MGKMLDILHKSQEYTGFSPLNPVNNKKVNYYEDKGVYLVKISKQQKIIDEYEAKLSDLRLEMLRLVSNPVVDIKSQGELAKWIEETVCTFFGVNIKGLHRRYGRGLRGTNNMKLAKHTVRFCLVHGAGYSKTDACARHGLKHTAAIWSEHFIRDWYSTDMGEDVRVLINTMCRREIFPVKA